MSLLSQIKALRSQPYHIENEAVIRQLEQELISRNYSSGKLQEYAKTHSQLLLRCQTAPVPTSLNNACILRYFWVPILYKLGKAGLANQIGQNTFIYLFPSWHTRIQAKIDALLGENKTKSIQKATDLFSIIHVDMQGTYSRIKSTNSVWKKIESISALEAMDNKDFAECIDDYLAFRWNMKVRAGENRFDALIRGIELLPDIKIIKFRNQQLPQSSGFDCEPVMKLLFNIEQIPIELQILGGSIEAYMNAKGYSDYKTKLKFYPQKKHLTQNQWEARLGTCIHQSETGEFNKNEELMLRELLGQKIIYDEAHRFVLDHAPRLPEHHKRLESFMIRVSKNVAS